MERPYRSDLIDENRILEQQPPKPDDNGVPRYALVNRPRIVCLCGSTRFVDAFREASKTCTLDGMIVLSVGMFGHQEGLDMDGQVKKDLDSLHFWKIRLADDVLILNVGGYIGESTRNELEFAKKHGKEIYYLEPVEVKTS